MRMHRTFLEGSKADSYVRVQSSYGEISLKLADCQDTVSIWFGGNRTKKQSLAKLAKLEKALALIREAIEASDEA